MAGLEEQVAQAVAARDALQILLTCLARQIVDLEIEVGEGRDAERSWWLVGWGGL